MALGTHNSTQQASLWIATQDLPQSAGHVFYERLNQILVRHKFDRFAEEVCAKFYAGNVGRPGTPPGVYFRCLLIGYFEGIDSERGIAWRCADSLSLRTFLGYALDQSPPDHSTISRTRRLIDIETHTAVFDFVLKVLAHEGLLQGKTLGVDATTLEANAALRSIVRRDSGETYQAFLTGLAQASGIETPTRSDLARIDRKRPKKGSNEDWEHPHDPDAAITKMKDGRTHLAHKAEHAVDMDTGAVVAVTMAGANEGDTKTLSGTVNEAANRLEAAAADEQAPGAVHEKPLQEIVADKGYHSNATMVELKHQGIRSYVSEPERGRRNWKNKDGERRAVYGNRRRIRGERGKRLQRLRGELLERTFAHCLETGGMRRVHLRGRGNILKRLLVHVSGFNLGLVMRKVCGVGTPRGLQGLRAALFGGDGLLSQLLALMIGHRMPLTADVGRILRSHCVRACRCAA